MNHLDHNPNRRYDFSRWLDGLTSFDLDYGLWWRWTCPTNMSVGIIKVINMIIQYSFILQRPNKNCNLLQENRLIRGILFGIKLSI